MANRIHFQVGYSVDKAGLSEMQSLFQRIANAAKEPGNQLNTGLQKAASTANTLDGILEKTFNTNLGTLNVTKFNQELSKSGMTLKSVQSDLSKAGNQGATAYNKLAQAVLGTNLQLKESNKLLDSMATTMANTVKWGITSSIFNTITNSIQKAYTYTKQLDTSLNDIRIVTDKSAESMEKFAVKANEAAKGLGASTLDYTNASLIYYQQGLSDEEVAARAETTIKAANITGQTGEAVSEQLTAVWNGYKVTAEETEAYVDKLAAVAATTAADLEELSVGMSKVASAANSMGVDFDDLNAQIATIVSVTRQAPESVGTALKTIYARLGDLKVDGVDEFGVKLGEVSAQMQQMGIQILDQQGNLRDMSGVIAEVASKWNTWTDAQKQAAAVAMAGKRQYNNLIALFDNWDMYTDALNTSTEAIGTLQHQQDIYMESTAAKLKTLKATWQDVYGDLVNEDELNAGIEGLTNLVQVFDNFIESFGGGIKSIAAFGSVVSNIFNKQIVDGINSAIQRQEVFKQNLELAQANAQIRANGIAEVGDNATPQQIAVQANAEKQLEIAKEIYDARVGLNQEQYNSLVNLQQEIGALEEEKVLIEEQVQRKQLAKINDVEINDILHKTEAELEEINADYGAMELHQEAITANTEKQVSKISSILSIDEQKLVAVDAYLGVINEVREVLNNLTVEQAEQVDQELQQIHSNDELIAKRQDLYKIISAISNKEKENLNIIRESNEAVQETIQARQRIQSVQENQKNAQMQAKALLDTAHNAKTTAQAITTVTSSLSTMAMAWSSVNSLIKTFNDESISFGDKLTQGFMTLGMTIPMVYSSFVKLNEVFPITLAATIAQTEAEKAAVIQHELTGKSLEAKIAREEANAAWEEFATTASVSRAYAESLQEKAIEKTAIANKLEEEAIIEEKAAQEMAILTSKGHIIAKAKEVVAIINHKTALDADTAAIILNKVALMGLVAVAALTVAAIAGIIKAIDVWHDKERERAKATLESVKETENEVEANKELISSFNDLYGQYNTLKNLQQSTTSVSEKLREQTLELAKAYDIQGASILALGDHYDLLSQRIKEARKIELENNQKQAQEGAAAASKAIGHDMSQGLTNVGAINNNTYSNQISSFDYNSRSNLVEAVKALGLENNLQELQSVGNVSEYAYNIKFNISNPEEAKKALEDINNIILYYKGKFSEEQLNLDPLYQSFLQEQEQAATQYEELLNQLSIKYASIAESAFLDIDFSKMDTSEIYNAIEKVKNDLKGAIPESEIDDVINNVLSGISSIEDSLSKIDLAERISKETGQAVDEILEILNNFNDSQLSLLEVNLDFALLDGDLKSWIEANEPVILNTKLVGQKNDLENALENYDPKEGGFKPEDTDSIMQSQALGENIDSNSFNFLDYGEQLQLVTNAWIENTAEIVKNKEELTNYYKDKQDQINQDIANYENVTNAAEEQFNEIINKDEKLKEKSEEVRKAIQELAEVGGDLKELDPEELGLIDKFKELADTDEDVADGIVDHLGEVFEQTENYQKGLDAVNALLEEVEDTSMDYAKIIDRVGDVESALSSELDNIQSAYKSLTSVMEDYNSTGAWTIDNVQQLMSMDDAYVATLQFENGQLSINEQAFQALTLAKLDEIETTIDLEYQTKMAELAQLAEAEANRAAIQAEAAHASSMAALGQAAEETAAKVRSLADSLAAISAYGSADIKNAADEATKAHDVKKQAINEARNSIRKGGSSFKKAMGGGGGGGKKGGGGGGGGGSKEEKEEKKYEDEFDRYWELTHAIDATDRALKRLEKDKENLYGYELIDALKQENELLDQQKANYEALLAAQQQEAAQLREQLSAEGVMFDASGAITNYAQATADALAKYNAAIAQYNAGLIDASALGVYEKNYEAFKEALQRYEKLYYTEIQDTQDKIDEIERKQLANNLKAWEVEVEIKLEKKQLERDWNDFIHDVTKDFQKVYGDLRVDLKNLLDDAKTYLGDDGTIGTIIDAVHDVTEEIDKLRDGEDSDMFESISQAQEKLKELNKQLLESGRDLHDLWEQAWDIYLDGIDQVADKFDDLIDRFERINDELEFQQEIIELLYGEEAYGLMSQLYEGQEHNLITQIDSLKQQKDMWEELWRQTGATMENQAEWNEDQRKYYEEWMEAQEDLNDLVVEYIELLKNDYLNTVSSILKELEKSITGSSLEQVKTEWERISDHADKYYDSIEGAYKIQTLANKINQSIADSNNLKAQEKLNALKEKEINYLRNKKNLTEYDLQAAEARYQIALKEIALEEAQNNKTSMKLTRNEEGNWSYQYVADEDDVMNKKQELLDAYGQLYQLITDTHEAGLESLLDLKEKFYESVREINENENLTEQERQQQLLELRTWFFQEYQLLAEENALYQDDLALASSALLLELYEQDQENYTALTEAERELVDELINANIDDYMELEEALTNNYHEIGDKAREVMSETRVDWTSGAQQMMDLWNKDSGFSVKVQVINAYTKIGEANEKYKQQVDDCAKRVERDFGEQGIVGAIKRAEEETDNLTNATADMVASSEAYLNDLRSYVDALADAWRSVQDEIMGAISLIQEYLGYVGEYEAGGGASGAAGGGGSGKESSSGGGGGGGGSGGGSGGSGGGNFSLGTDFQGASGVYYVKNNDTGKVVEASGNKDKLKKKYGLATGGYTGSWNGGDTDGRLAFLHQKELVLNKDDTSNFLSGISMLRDMSSLNGTISDAIMSAIAGMVYKLANGKTNSLNTNSTKNEENKNIFNITAEFPNANSVDEIREAILSLPNMASQYINK